MSPYVDDEGTIVGDDGNPMGEIVQAEDGAFVAVGYDGQIFDAAAPDGTPLDPSGYEVAGGEPDLSALEAQVAALEEQMHAQQYAQPVPPFEAQDPQHDLDVIAANFEQAARRAGRDLTSAEVHKVMGLMQDQISAGRDVDFDKATAEAAIRPVHEMDREERVAWQMQRLHEAEHEGNPEPQPQRQEYDLSDGTQRREWMQDRVSGALDDQTAQAVAYDGTDQPEAA